MQKGHRRIAHKKRRTRGSTRDSWPRRISGTGPARFGVHESGAAGFGVAMTRFRRMHKNCKTDGTTKSKWGPKQARIQCAHNAYTMRGGNLNINLLWKAAIILNMPTRGPREFAKNTHRDLMIGQGTKVNHIWFWIDAMRLEQIGVVELFSENPENFAELHLFQIQILSFPQSKDINVHQSLQRVEIW